MDADPQAHATVEEVTSLLVDAGLSPAVAARCAALCIASADPRGASSGLQRFVTAYVETLGRPPSLDGPLLDRLVPLLAGSRFLSRELASRPRGIALLASTPWFSNPKPQRILERRLRARLAEVALDDEAGLYRALRRFKYEEFLRIAARDLGGAAPLQEITAELSLLARVCIEEALARIARLLREQYGAPPGCGDLPGMGLAILGMGKLGAEELNFSSDVDLMLIHRETGPETEGGELGSIPFERFYARLAERLVRALSQVTEDGFVFRVDLDLRPEGRAGPIAIGAEAAFRYYEARGRGWERAALLRARPLAGDRELGQELLSSLEPFIFRRYLDLPAVEEIRAIKARIDREASAADRSALHLKLGHGGIREAEFVVVALLLLHAGKNPRLRERRFLPALEKLVFAGLLSAQDRDALADAYVFLRRAEHRLQMVNERQTHEVPEAADEVERLARRMGFRGAAQEVCRDFHAELSRHRQAIRERFDDLLGVSGVAPRQEDPELAVALDPARDDDRRIEALARCGFFDPPSALGELKRLSLKAGTPFAPLPAPILEGQAEALLAEAIRSPNPDRALRTLGDFTAALRSPRPYFELLAQSPATARLLIELFGTTDALSRYFVRHPELLDSLLRRDGAAPQKGRPRLRRELAERLSRHDDPEQKLAALRRFKQEEILRIGLNDVSGDLPLEGVMAELTAVAEACLEEALALAEAELIERHGPLPTARLAILGLGKLGSGELGYQSDLDLVFLYTHPEERSAGGRGKAVTAGEWFTRLVQRLISHLQLPLREGILYRIDTRLRPSGSQGALVVSLGALETYHRTESALWERQALLRARHVAGDPAVSEAAFSRVLEPLLFQPDPEPRQLASAIAGMRRRLEEASLAAGGNDPKLDPGGLLDVEFAVQYLQLLHGAAVAELRFAPILPAISILAGEGLLDEDTAEQLARGWRFLRRLELSLQIVHDRPTERLPEGRFGRLALGRRLGFTGDEAGEALLAAYRQTTASIRGAFQRILEEGE